MHKYRHNNLYLRLVCCRDFLISGCQWLQFWMPSLSGPANVFAQDITGSVPRLARGNGAGEQPEDASHLFILRVLVQVILMLTPYSCRLVLVWPWVLLRSTDRLRSNRDTRQLMRTIYHTGSLDSWLVENFPWIYLSIKFLLLLLLSSCLTAAPKNAWNFFISRVLFQLRCWDDRTRGLPSMEPFTLDQPLVLDFGGHAVTNAPQRSAAFPGFLLACTDRSLSLFFLYFSFFHFVCQ